MKIDKFCFDAYKSSNIECKNKECRMWVNSKNNKNCTIIASSSGPKTLHEIGEMFSVTRMRICQLEKKIIARLSLITRRSNIAKENIT